MCVCVCVCVCVLCGERLRGRVCIVRICFSRGWNVKLDRSASSYLQRSRCTKLWLFHPFLMSVKQGYQAAGTVPHEIAGHDHEYLLVGQS